ncbi:MAG: YtxH domain-containing protein [Bacteroidales bacterium]|nr:YtxH domain-containing protein [Bacteroidales bacterium]
MKGSHLIAFLGGALTATAIALLYLTDEGTNIREKIKKHLEDKGMKLSQEELDRLVDKVKDELNGLNNKNKSTSKENV